jgi:hypothetical protein
MNFCRRCGAAANNLGSGFCIECLEEGPRGSYEDLLYARPTSDEDDDIDGDLELFNCALGVLS